MVKLEREKLSQFKHLGLGSHPGTPTPRRNGKSTFIFELFLKINNNLKAVSLKAMYYANVKSKGTQVVMFRMLTYAFVGTE